jgi:hypothetical protein
LTGVAAADGRRHSFFKISIGETDMHTLTLNDDQRILIIEILGGYLTQLSHEAHQTDDRAYRDMLEQKQSTVQQLLKELQES